MTDEELRQACESFAEQYIDEFLMSEGNGALLAFARRMQAVGLREVQREIRRGIQCGACLRVDDWCEAEAQKLEGP